MLSGALDDRGADLAELLRTLTEDVGLAVPSFLGLSVSLLVGGDALGWTAMIEPHAGHEIGTSARLPLVALGRVEGSSEIVFYAGTPGGFVDLAADVSFVLGIDPSTVVLDDDLIPPEHSGGVSGLADVSLVNQAVGALIDRMGGAEAARAELGRLADTGRHSVLQAAIEVVRSTAAPPRSRREILRDLAASAPGPAAGDRHRRTDLVRRRGDPGSCSVGRTRSWSGNRLTDSSPNRCGTRISNCTTRS